MANSIDYNRKFSSKVVAATPDDLFTLSAGVLRNMVLLLSNNSASPVVVSGWLIPSGGSAATGNKFIPDDSIEANSSLQVGVPKMIAGDKLTLQAGTADVLTVFEDDSATLI